jgi:serine/threonine-protein kinase SRPK3
MSHNILFQVSDQVRRWSDSEIYSTLGEPETDKIVTIDGSPSEPHAPREVVENLDGSRLSVPPLPVLEENIVVTDFGQSFDTKHPPKDYGPSTIIYYFPPEALFDRKFSFASDVWILVCTIFEIRAGHSLMSSYLADDATVVRDAVGLLGKLPEPWWSAFKRRDEENGEPKPTMVKSSIRRRLRQIGEGDEPPRVDEGRMIEAVGTPLEEEEVALLGDLLEKMLKYRPEERITMQEVVQHPWFEYNKSLNSASICTYLE